MKLIGKGILVLVCVFSFFALTAFNPAKALAVNAAFDVEHNIKVALSLANRVYLMGKAHVGFSGSVEELKANPQAREKYLEV